MVPTEILHRLLQEQGIALDWYPLPTNVLGMYRRSPLLRCPVIVLNECIAPDSAAYRTVLAHELGHHFTTSADNVRLLKSGVSHHRVEARANRWAATFMIPTEYLAAAYNRGIVSSRELAEHFHVLEELVMHKYHALQVDVRERLRFHRLLKPGQDEIAV